MSIQERAPTASLAPIAKSEWSPDHARHLLWRAGFGGPPRQITFLTEAGPEGAVDALLNFKATEGYPDTKPDDFHEDIMRPLTSEERQELQRARRAQDEDTLARFRLRNQQQEQSDRRQMNAMQRWWLRRMIESPRPLEEKLTLFWHGHFATSYRTIENSYHMFMQNRLFRSHAAGNFGELLHAIIRDPAMIAYLDNNDSRKNKPNENLARELMELFTLGEGAYTEKDIKEGARALTGYSYESNVFVFHRERHDDGQKTILGKSGNLDGDGFVRAILDRRETSEFIALKLYRYFVADLPPEKTAAYRTVVGVIRQLASTLLAANYDLKPMLQKLFLSKHFYDPVNRLARIKSPAELVVGAVRSFNTPVRDLGILNDALDRMGQNLFYPPSVKGWDGGRSWINTSTLFVRANIINFLLTGKTPRGYDALADEEPFNPITLTMEASEEDQGAESDPDRLAAYLLRFALGMPAEESRRAVIAHYLGAKGEMTNERIAGAIALIATLPEYQLC